MTREEAIKVLQSDKELYQTDICHAGDGTPDGELLEALDMAIETLQDRPTGEWENVYSGLTDDTLRFRCNHCGAVSDGRHNYCPNCGAIMEV